MSLINKISRFTQAWRPPTMHPLQEPPKIDDKKPDTLQSTSKKEKQKQEEAKRKIDVHKFFDEIMPLHGVLQYKGQDFRLAIYPEAKNSPAMQKDLTQLGNKLKALVDHPDFKKTVSTAQKRASIEIASAAQIAVFQKALTKLYLRQVNTSSDSRHIFEESYKVGIDTDRAHKRIYFKRTTGPKELAKLGLDHTQKFIGTLQKLDLPDEKIDDAVRMAYYSNPLVDRDGYKSFMLKIAHLLDSHGSIAAKEKANELKSAANLIVLPLDADATFHPATNPFFEEKIIDAENDSQQDVHLLLPNTKAVPCVKYLPRLMMPNKAGTEWQELSPIVANALGAYSSIQLITQGNPELFKGAKGVKELIKQVRQLAII